MGEVYRAHDSRLERQVAVKVLPEHLSQSPQALARFVRETKAVAALSPQTAFGEIRPGKQAKGTERDLGLTWLRRTN